MVAQVGLGPIIQAATRGLRFTKPIRGSKGLQNYADDFVNFFKNTGKKSTQTTSGLSKSRLIRDVGITAGLTTTVGLLTQTPGGLQTQENVSNFSKQFSDFVKNNSLLIAGGLVVLGLLVIKK